jgi:hypothetical protein
MEQIIASPTKSLAAQSTQAIGDEPYQPQTRVEDALEYHKDHQWDPDSQVASALLHLGGQQTCCSSAFLLVAAGAKASPALVEHQI